jgi:phosphoserine phosphatase RsbU/P
MDILIADDDCTSRLLLTSMLRKCGYAVHETVNGTEAWDLLQRPDAPRMAILDWMMPEMDGIEVCRRVRTLPTPHPPYIILLTARGAREDIVRGLKAGADDYLAKPYDAGELLARLGVGKRMLAIQDQLADKIGELQEALERIKTLRGIVPICAKCKNIRNDAGYWQQVEVYVREHTEAEFSHGLCPECMKVLYPDFCNKDDAETS